MNTRRTAPDRPSEVVMSPVRASLLGAAAAVLLAGCGSGGYGSDSSSTTDAATATGTAADSEFCARAADIDQRVEDGLDKLDDEDSSVADAFRQLAEELRGLDAPDAISSEVAAMADGLDRMAEAFDGIDITDPETLTALDDAEGNLSEASDKVDAFLSDECGIE
jgi:hypothetical protein